MNSVKNLTGLLGLLLAAGFQTSVHAQNLVVNPSFEAGSTTNYTVDDWTMSSTFPTAGAPLGYVPDSGYLATVPNGTRLLIFNAGGNSFTGSVSQTLSTAIGSTYNVVLNVGAYSNQIAGRNQRLQITASGATPAFTQLVPVTSTTGTASLAQFSYSFVAGAASTTLTLSDASTGLSNNTNADLLVDNVRVTLDVPNTAPTAVADSYNVSANNPLIVNAATGVLANDTDPQGNPLTAVKVTDPSHGSVTLNADGSFTYTPNSGYTGSDSFTYKANDGNLDSGTVTVSLTVAIVPVNVLVNGSFENGAVDIAPQVTALDNWVLSGAGIPRGLIADSTNKATHPTAAAPSRLAIFNAGVNGGANVYGGAISQTFSTVAGTSYDLKFDVGAVGTAGRKQKVLVTATGTASPFSEATTVTATAAATYTAKAYSFVASGTSVTLTFTDSSGTLVSPDNATFSDLLLDNVRVEGLQAVNTAPTAVADTYSTPRNTALTVPAGTGVLANDTDPENNTLSAVKLTDPANGIVTLSSNGGFTYTPTTGYTGPDSFTYKANDGNLDSNIVTVSLTVTPPVLASFTNGSFENGAVLSGNVTAIEDWTVTGNPIGYIADASYPATHPTTTAPSRLVVFNGGSTTYGGSISQSFTTVPGETYDLTYDVGIIGTTGRKQRISTNVTGISSSFPEVTTITKGAGVVNWVAKSHTFVATGTSVTLSFTDTSNTITAPDSANPSDLLLDHVQVAVHVSNHAPVAVADSYSTQTNTALNVAAPGLLANDTDSDGNPLTAIKVTNPSHGTVTVNADGSFTYSPTTGYTGADSFTYKANDGSLDSNTVTVSLTVSATPSNYVVNGSFENGAAATAPFYALDSWTVTGNPAGYIADSSYTAQDGARLAIFNGGGNTFGGTISQTFATVVGQAYKLEFKMGIFGRDDISGAGNRKQRLLVTATGTGSLLSTPADAAAAVSGTAVSAWYDKEMSFVADSTSTTFTFTDTGNTVASPDSAASSDLLLDHVRITEILTARTLTVNSSPVTGLGVTVSPSDLGSNGNGTTSFTRSYAIGNTVTLTATAASGPNVFQKWQKDGVDAGTNVTTTVTMNADHTMTAVYLVDNSPRATADSYTTAEDTPLVVSAPGVLSNDTDPNSVAITAVVDANPTHGTLSLAANGGFTYTPAENYHGADSFTYHATNGTQSSAVTTVSLTVTSVNDLPVATAQTLSTDEDVPLPITLAGTDLDGESLTYAIVGNPAHGTLTGTGANRTYTPAANYNGPDSFTFKVNDGTADSAATATVSITVNPIADVPVANNQSVSLTAGTALAITLTGSDPDGQAVTFNVTGSPAHGTLSGTAPNLTYTPVANYVGSDSFTFVTNDGTSDSAPATVSISVNDVLLNGSFELATGTAPNLVPTNWTVSGNYEIAASGSYPGRNATDGTRLLVLNSGNRTPNAVLSQSFATTPGRPYILSFDLGATGLVLQQRLRVTLTGSSQLKQQDETISGPGGTASAWTSNRTIAFTANSATTTLELRDATSPASNGNNTDLLVDKVRIAPQITRALTVAASPETGVAVTVSPADINAAQNGTTGFTRTYMDGAVVSLTAPALVGTSHFQKWQRDGADFATTAATTVTMNAAYTMTAFYVANQAPVTTADTYSTDEDTALVVPVGTGVLSNDSDPESLPITAVLETGPANGTLTLNPNGSFNYTPNENFFGTDSFTYKASDTLAQSAATTVTITVISVNDTPVATAQAVTVTEDGSVGITLAGTDIEGSTLAYSVGSPSHGILTGTAPDLTYTPAADYSGPDSFTFTVNDGTVNSAPATVTITVTAVNDAPVANAQTLTVAEDGTLSITLTGSDADGNPLTFATGSVSHGTLTGTGNARTYTPASNYHGSDSFTFTVNDGTVTSAAATVSITVTPVNDAPVATAQSVTVAEDGSVVITLAGTDVENSALTFVTGSVSHGTLTGTGNTRTYTPTGDYHGSDSFTFTVNDGDLTSAAATVSITVTPVNDAPVANAQTLSVAEDGTLNITLTGSDIDAGDTLTFATGAVSHGTLTGTGNTRTYKPAADYHGSDSFTVTVNDGTVNSAPATISITVTPVNDAPVATAQSVTVAEDGSVVITLAGTDVENSALTFATGSVSHGTLTGTGSTRTYTPAADYHGADSFTFTVNDGDLTSVAATVTITVTPVNDSPVANAQTLTVAEDGTLNITLTGTDVDLDALTFATGAVSHGTLTGTGNTRTYTPAANYHGTDSFTFTVNDGTATSTAATVSITVTPENDAPVATAQSVTVAEDGSVLITLAGTDVEESALTFAVGSASHGTLTGAGNTRTYTPAADYNGSDNFTFTVNDGDLTSAPATVSITVTPVNDAPVATAQSVTVAEDGSVLITLAGTDIDASTTLTFATGTVSHGTLTGTGNTRTYTPAADYNGSDSFTFTVNDGDLTSAPATVSITVTPVNDAPVATAQSVTVAEDGSVVITLVGTDVENSGLTFATGSASHGTLTGTGATRTYTPAADYHGADSFTFTVNDGDLTSAAATVSITVTLVNDAPVATAQTLTVAEDGSVLITLAGTDADNDPLTFASGTVSHGTLTGTGNTRTYTPAADYNGSDSFTFSVNDGTATSLPATVSLTVTPVNDAPVATAQSVTVAEDGSVLITLAGTDVDAGTTLTFATGTVSHGTLTGTGNTRTYTPSANYNGPDSFTFTVNDGTVSSAPATVTITVTAREEFAQWLQSYGISDGVLVDSDGDSIINSIEYVIGGNPANRHDEGLLPTGVAVTADPDNNSTNENYLLFTYRRTDLANADPSTVIGVEWDADLAGTWTNADTSAGVVKIVENGIEPGVDLVHVYLPRSLSPTGKLFARLKVAVTLP